MRQAPVIAAILVALLLSACAASVSPTPTPTLAPTPLHIITTPEPTPTPEPKPTPEPTPAPEPTPTPTPIPLGRARSNPEPMSTPIQGQLNDLNLGNIQVRITLKEMIRGTQAWTLVQQANNQLTDPPKDGSEYLLVRITFEYLQGDDPNAQYRLSPAMFTVVSSDGLDYDMPSIVVPSPALRANLYPGAAYEGWVAFRVNIVDEAPLLTFGRDRLGRGGLWWKLY